MNSINNQFKIDTDQFLSFVLPTFNESENIILLLDELLSNFGDFQLELIVIDDNSSDGTHNLVRERAKKDRRIRLINRLDRSGLSSAIKEGCLNASGEIIAIMDTDGQHQVSVMKDAIKKLLYNRLDVVIGSRFHNESEIKGLSQKRENGSKIANSVARFSLPKKYSHLTDYMSGCIVLQRKSCISLIKKIDVNGFKFLYELLAISKGRLKVNETSMSFQPRKYGVSKFNLAIIWDFLISLVHTICRRIIPRKAISFAFVGAIGVLIQMFTFYCSIIFLGISFNNALTFAVVVAASSNFLINNWLTFSTTRLRNKALIIGLFKFLLVSSLPIIANIGLATSFYKYISPNSFFSQISAIIIVYIWNYAASSRLVWNR